MYSFDAANRLRRMSPPDSDSDRVLVARIERRDADALAVLYDRHGSRLNGLACRILQDVAEADEVLQDVFLYVWRAASSFDGARGSVLAWLIVATRSRAIDRRRARRGAPRVSLDQAPEPVSSEDVEALSSGREWEAICRRAVGELPEEQRRALELAYFDGLTHQEIAEKTASPLGTVKTRIRLGLMKLRERIRPYLGQESDAS